MRLWRSLFLSSGVALLAFPAPGETIKPVAVFGKAPLPTWDGPQFVQADRAGNVFFFRGTTLEVYRLTKEGDFAKPLQLKTSNAGAGFVHSAALSADGSQWLVYSDFSVRRFIDGEEATLPSLRWNPWGVTFLRDTPIVAVIPRPLDRIRNLPETMEVPWLLQLGSDDWNPITRVRRLDVARLLKEGRMNEAIAEDASFLEDDHEGKLWVARQYSYHVQRFNSSGHILLDITVPADRKKQEIDNKGIEVQLHPDGKVNPTEATRTAQSETAIYHPFTAPHVLLALAEGRDGRFYFLGKTQEGGVALDRYDPERVALERVPLQLHLEGTGTMAAGRDGLYIAAIDGKQGRWKISWDALDQATWKNVAGAEIDGIKASEDHALPPPPASIH